MWCICSDTLHLSPIYRGYIYLLPALHKTESRRGSLNSSNAAFVDLRNGCARIVLPISYKEFMNTCDSAIMANSRSILPAGRTDSFRSVPTVGDWIMPSTEPTQHGFALGERPFFQPIHEKSDAEALREWENEGGAPSPPRKKPKANKKSQ